MAQVVRLNEDLFVLNNPSGNAGLLVRDGRALLFDCHTGCTPRQLSDLGVRQLAGICLTQHRRTQTDGIGTWLEQGVPVYGSDYEAEVLEQAGRRWTDPAFRWRRFAKMVPDLAMPASDIRPVQRVRPGQAIDVFDFDVLAVDAAGSSPGALAWLVQIGPQRILFSGQSALAGGRLPNLWMLQKGFGRIQDYHGILGAAPDIRETWRRFLALEPDILVPGAGPIDHNPAEGLVRLGERMVHLQQNVMRASALNFYFPDLYLAWDRNWPRLAGSDPLPLPPFVQGLCGTSFLLRAQNGAGFLIDCGDPAAAGLIMEQIRSGSLLDLEAVWITHMHYDHTEGLVQLLEHFSCPVLASRLTADTLCHPDAYFLPCQYPVPFPVKGLADKTTFAWREFTLTAYEFPGQVLHHGALLVEGYGQKVLFVGDSFSSTGLDDYCPQNRVLPGKNRGMRRCLDLIRQIQPDLLINQHRRQAFRLEPDMLDELERVLIERDRIAEELTGRSAGWAWDDAWCRVYPFEQTAQPGAIVTVAVHITNHDAEPLPVRVEPVLPAGCRVVGGSLRQKGVVPPLTAGSHLAEADPDFSLEWKIALPVDTDQATLPLIFRISCRVTEGPAAIGLVQIRS